MENIIIIGAGPAGISAALYAARGNMDPLIINTGIGSLEKAEKKKTINRPFSPRSPKYRTQVYAPPAAIPPKKPQTLANKFALAKVGLIMQSAPKNATTIAIACLGRTFSLIKTAEKSSAKKGLILLSIDASLRSSRSMA